MLPCLIAMASANLNADLGKPTKEQIEWHKLEIEMFVCLDPCTWQNREYDDHSTPLSKINPAKLNTDQWCQTAKLIGAKQILFVAKHTGGFCWWHTETSKYGIKDTPFKRDVLAELSQSCKKNGLKLAIYVYPGDDQWGAGMGSGGVTADPSKQEGYNKVFRQQMTEVLSKYGPISEVWFDGSCKIEVGDILKKHAPKAVVLQGPYTTLRWPGTESGMLQYPAWQTVKSDAAKTGVSTQLDSDPDGDVWLPMECDTTLLDHKWFWGENTDHMMKPLDRLMEIYYKSVGYGGVLLLNSTPDTNGLIPESHMKRYKEFGLEVKRRFGKPIASTKGFELDLRKPTLVDHTILMEDIRLGHVTREYHVEALVDGVWKTVVSGSSIGYKKIDQFSPVLASKLRFVADKAVGAPKIDRFAAFYVGPTSGGTAAPLDKSWKDVGVWTGSGSFDFDLSKAIPRVGVYEIEFVGGSVESAVALLEGVENATACRISSPTTVVLSRSQVTEGKGKESTGLRVRLRAAGSGKVRVRAAL